MPSPLAHACHVLRIATLSFSAFLAFLSFPLFLFLDGMFDFYFCSGPKENVSVSLFLLPNYDHQLPLSTLCWAEALLSLPCVGSHTTPHYGTPLYHATPRQTQTECTLHTFEKMLRVPTVRASKYNFFILTELMVVHISLLHMVLATTARTYVATTNQ